jgi:cytochrome c oxidase assembly factor CtaG
VTSPEPERARRAWVPGLRRWLWALGVLTWVACVVPPVASWARRYEYAQAVQFVGLGFWAPTLITAGAPWRAWRLARVGPDGAVAGALGGRRRINSGRAVASAIAFIAASVLWRAAPAVDALSAHPWLVAVEGVTLGALGVAVMADLIESPPLRPGVSRPFRIGVSAAVMWSAWVVAYLEAMSGTPWYRAFQHVAHRAVSAATDQQLAAGAVWFMTAVVFVPVIFWNLIHWLQAEEDPDEELHKLVREERTRGFFGYRD